MRAHGLYERSDWARVLASASPSPGRLVHRLDRDDRFHYLVPFRSPRGTVAIASVDARTGDYQRAALLPKRDPTRVSAEEATKLVAGRRLELPNDQGRLLVRKQAMALYPQLVWRPCRESLSPFYPFYLFIVGDRRIYVRVDGYVFTSLTLDSKGI